MTVATPVTVDSNLEAKRKAIEEARADARERGVIPHEAIEAWVESWDTDHELPPPEPSHKLRR